MIQKDISKLKTVMGKCNFSEKQLRKFISEDQNQERYVFELTQSGLLNNKNTSILIVGSGRGGLAINLLKKGYKVDNVEYNPCYCKIISWKLEKYKLKSKLINSAIEDFKSDKKYDIAIMMDVIEHVQDPTKALKVAHNLLKKDGKLYLTVPTRFQLIDPHYKLPLICFLPNKMADYILKKTGIFHYDKSAGMQSLSEMHYFSYGKFTKIAKKIGFNIIDMRKKEIFFPNRFIFKESQQKYYNMTKMFKQLKLTRFMLPLIRLFFGHKFILVKQ